jgi:hypothetical protein
VLSAQLNNASAAKGDTVLPFDNVTAGSWSNIVKDQTMYVGTTSGGRDIGRIRVKSATSGAITLGRNDHIKWVDNLFLTVVNFIEPWGVFHRITLDPNDFNANPFYYKDNTDVYTDQNTKIPPVVCMGSHNAVFKGETIDWHSSGTYSPVGAGLSSYAWAFGGGTPSTSSTAHPGAVTYNTNGDFSTSLTVTDANGKSSTGYRYLVVLDGPDADIQSWGMDSLTGSRSQGGWTAQMWIRERQDIVEGSLMIVFAEDWYRGVKLAIPNTIVFIGYVQNKTLHWDWKTGKLEFAVQGICNMAAGRETYGVALDSIDSGGDNVGDGRDWTRMYNITTDKGLVHYMMFHTTLLRIADFHPIGNNNLKMFCDIAHGPIYGAMESYLQQNLIADIVANRAGQMYAEIDLAVQPSGSRTPPITLSMDRRDWRGAPEIQRVLVPTTSYVEMGGVVYGGGLSGTITPLLSGAPGETPSYQGSPQTREGLALASQDQLNVLNGDYYANLVNEFPQVTFPMAGNYRFFDIAPQERTYCTLDGTETPDGLVWTNKPLIPQEINHQYNKRGHMLLTDVTFKAETAGFPGDTIIIPTVPPDGTCEDCSAPCTSDDCTEPPASVESSSTGGTPGGTVCDENFVVGILGAGVFGLHVYATANWRDAVPTWGTLGLAGDLVDDPQSIVVTDKEYSKRLFVYNAGNLYSYADINVANAHWVLLPCMAGSTIADAIVASPGGSVFASPDQCIVVGGLSCNSRQAGQIAFQVQISKEIGFVSSYLGLFTMISDDAGNTVRVADGGQIVDLFAEPSTFLLAGATSFAGGGIGSSSLTKVRLTFSGGDGVDRVLMGADYGFGMDTGNNLLEGGSNGVDAADAGFHCRGGLSTSRVMWGCCGVYSQWGDISTGDHTVTPDTGLTSPRDSYINAIAMARDYSKALGFDNNNHIWRVTNGNHAWSDLGDIGASFTGKGLCAMPDGGDHFAACGNGFRRSIDGGVTWVSQGGTVAGSKNFVSLDY